MSMYFKEPFDKEKIEKQHEELLNIFKEDLSNLSDKTIKKHIQNVDFFINEYLLIVIMQIMKKLIMKLICSLEISLLENVCGLHQIL